MNFEITLRTSKDFLTLAVLDDEWGFPPRQLFTGNKALIWSVIWGEMSEAHLAEMIN